MNSWLPLLLSVLQSGWRLFLTISLATAVVLFMPDAIIAALGLKDIVGEYRGWIVGAFLLATAMTATYVVSTLGGWGKMWWEGGKPRRDMAARIKRLSDNERRMLGVFVREGVRVTHLPYDLPAVHGLRSLGLITMTNEFIQNDRSALFTIDQAAWDYLRERGEAGRG